MIPNVNNEHVAEGLAHLTDHFRKQTNVRAILAALLAPIQDLEDTVWAMHLLRMLDTADTDQLNKLGALVGEPRLDRTNDDYRAAIRLRIRVNRSEGRTEDVIDVARLAFGAGAVRYTEGTGGGFRLEVLDVTWFDRFVDMITEARAIGTAGNVVFSTWPREESLVLDSVYGGVASPGTLDSVYGGVANPGKLSSVRST